MGTAIRPGRHAAAGTCASSSDAPTLLRSGGSCPRVIPRRRGTTGPGPPGSEVAVGAFLHAKAAIHGPGSARSEGLCQSAIPAKAGAGSLPRGPGPRRAPSPSPPLRCAKARGKGVGSDSSARRRLCRSVIAANAGKRCVGLAPPPAEPRHQSRERRVPCLGPAPSAHEVCSDVIPANCPINAVGCSRESSDFASPAPRFACPYRPGSSSARVGLSSMT